MNTEHDHHHNETAVCATDSHSHGVGCDHTEAPSIMPAWVQERWEFILVGLAAGFFLIGWLGETFFDMSANAALIFYLLSYAAGGYDITIHGIPDLFRGRFDTDILMLAAAVGAAVLGQWSEGAFLLFLFSLGHAGEHYALERAQNAVDALGELMPKTARVKRGARIVEEAVDGLAIGDVVVVRPGDRVPVDGEITAGRSAIDQSAITGESMPVEKGIGDALFAGTINQEAALEVKVSKLAKNNTLSRVMQMVADAQREQSPTQQFTQKFTAVFVPAVFVMVLLVTAVPPLLHMATLQESFYRAMLLLVGASPCALALGTPAAVLAGIAQAARNGVLIKGGQHLENLGDVQVMAFDKTGTLTTGNFQITDIVPAEGVGADELLRVAAAVEQQSNHPLALAVVQTAVEKTLSLPVADGLENVAGRGVKSVINGRSVLIGSLKLFDGDGVDAKARETIAQLESEGKTTMSVTFGGQFLGTLALADTVRPHVDETLKRLLDLGVKELVMLTGDNADAAANAAQAAGVTKVMSDLMPEDKLAAIKSLQQKYGTVGMVGDGVNDAPALATATVGIGMGGAGTAVALETADVALMADDLGKLPFAVGLSRASRAIIKQNLFIALGVIMMLILTSVTGVMKLSGTVIVHEGSTVVVIINALRLLRYRE